MLIGVPKEIKPNENRVGLTPQSVKEFIRHGHDVMIEQNAGQGIGCSNDDYRAAGAKIVDTAAEIFASAEMIVKVKEPQEVEYKQLRENQILYTYLHLSPDVAQTNGLIDSGCIAIAYETVTDNHGHLPLLAPMSEVAGRMATLVGAYHLQKAEGGLGALLGGVPGVQPSDVTVIGGGVAGMNAIKIAMGMGANVTVLDTNIDRLRYLDDVFGGQLDTLYSTQDAVDRCLLKSALVIGTVLIPGANAPKLIRRDVLKNMKAGSVIVDVAIDQGGCAETSKPTTHENPTYIVEDVVHYCVANMPGGVPFTSTFALNNATLRQGLALANKGARQAMLDDAHLLNGLNVCQGKVTYQAVAEAQNLSCVNALDAVNALN